MKEHKRDTSDWLSALTIMGRIMLLVPIIIAIIVFISSIFWQSEIVTEPPVLGEAPATSLQNETTNENSGEGPTTITILQRNRVAETLTPGGVMIFLCGAATLIYVAVKRFRRGLRGEDEE